MIVGAGITGALVAEVTSAAGLSTLIVDRRASASGSTAASTALLQFEIDTPLIHLAELIGFEAASQTWRLSLAAVRGLADLIEKLKIACSLRSRTAIYLAGTTLGADALAQECQLRASIGLPSHYLNRSSLFSATGINRDAALISKGAADLNPVQLTNGLFRCAIDRGARLHTPVELAEVVPLNSGVGIVTNDGLEVEAKALVFATGYELPHGVPTTGHRRTSTWAFATRQQPQSLLGVAGSVIWEASEPYLYMRSTTDGRLIVGGEDESFSDEAARDALLEDKLHVLQAKTRALLPWIDVEAAHGWAGTFGESETGLPTIGPVPGMPHCFAVLGYGGNGITFSYLAAQLLRGYLCGPLHPDAALFAFKK